MQKKSAEEYLTGKRGLQTLKNDRETVPTIDIELFCWTERKNKYQSSFSFFLQRKRGLAEEYSTGNQRALKS